MNPTIKISAFKDISAFLLTKLQENSSFNLEIKYVQNADEAHQDLKESKADMVFMSYDDTLSLALEDKYADILAILPIHGGILDLTGEIDLEAGKNKVGIDTNSGYARALRLYLGQKYDQEQYQNLSFEKAGATNLRYEKLITNQIDATLLNPPFSYLPGVKRDPSFQEFLGSYQGVVANTNKSTWQDPNKRALLQQFINSYETLIQDLQVAPTAAIQNLADFYHLPLDTATNIYDRLWMPNGLNKDSQFRDAQLQGTEQIFSWDTEISIPTTKYWTL
ncbi:MAG: hypothetical protein ACRC6M_18800 [Microcystaceae cyanobacterium]